jgi:hypothetical protein
MASRQHQLIAGLVSRKMREKEYVVVSFEGKGIIATDFKLKIPPKIIRHRPDILGINYSNKRICIGEAKLRADLSTNRTKEQFIDFADVLTKDKNEVELIIGIPKSAEYDLLALLDKLNLSNKPNVSYVWVPDELLEQENIDNEETI